jgi:hypothetical protein
MGVAALAAPVVGLLGTDALAMSVTVAGAMLAGGGVLALVVGSRRLAELDAVAEAAETGNGAEPAAAVDAVDSAQTSAEVRTAS